MASKKRIAVAVGVAVVGVAGAAAVIAKSNGLDLSESFSRLQTAIANGNIAGPVRSIADYVKHFYSANPVSAGLATVAGLTFVDLVACLASQKVTRANAYVGRGVGRAGRGVGRAARGLYRNVRHHPRGWGMGLAATVVAGSLALGAVNARNYSSLEDTLNSQQVQARYLQDEINAIELKKGPQGPAGSQGERGYAGVQGSRGEQGIQGLVGPQGPAGSQGPAGKAGEVVYVTPTPTPTPTPTATPTPYMLPDKFDIIYSTVLSIKGRDTPGFAAAIGMKPSTLEVLTNGDSKTDVELVRVTVDAKTGAVTMHELKGNRLYKVVLPGVNAGSVVDYLRKNATPQELSTLVAVK